MDPQTPRALGDSEDSEPERRAPGRTSPPKKSLERFLAEFEARLNADPGQPATSASAALEGRAGGAWRTPVEGAERQLRRLPRRSGPGRSLPPAVAPAPSAGEAPAVSAGAEVTAPTPLGREGRAPAIEGPPMVAEAAPVEAAATSEAGVPETGPGRRRARRHRRHRRR